MVGGRRAFDGRQPSVEDDFQWKMTFSGRRPSVEDDLQWRMTFGGSLHAAYSALRRFLSILFVVEWSKKSDII